VSRFRKLFFGAFLALATVAGASVRIEEVEELMQAMNQPKVVHVLREEELNSEPGRSFRLGSSVFELRCRLRSKELDSYDP
jgi:hypothetical protein